MVWTQEIKRPFGFPMWTNAPAHFILKFGRFFLLFEKGKKGIQSRHETLEDAQNATG